MARSPFFRTIGILGGMGAEAGIELARRLVEASGARTDAEQIPCLLYTNPCIPDRPAALLRGGPSPIPELVRSLRMLEAAGAEILALPCNTVHAWYDEMQPAVSVPIVHMIRTMTESHPRELGTEVGVLCTSGLSAAGVYQACCAQAELHAVMPTDEEQELYVMRAIYGDLDAGLVGLKGSNKSAAIVQLMEAGAHRLIDRGATALWLACTEISLIKAELSAWSPVPVVDAMDALVDELIRLARK